MLYKDMEDFSRYMHVVGVNGLLRAFPCSISLAVADLGLGTCLFKLKFTVF